MKEIKNIRAYSKLPFPHYLGAEVARLEKKQVGTKKEQIQGVWKDVPIFDNVMGTGLMNIISNPNDIVEIGDLLAHPYHNGITYEVLNINESRKAMGDWSFVDFEPIYQQLDVKVI